RYFYRIFEGSFSQPNRGVNEQMIEWILERVLENKRADLLELYCGHGNFTIPFSTQFRKVLATEISKTSINAAKQNSTLNNVQNITFVRLSSEELTEALEGRREFRRLEGVNLFAYDFTHVLIDPPRAGLDDASREFVRRFENIIYISCNPETLERNLRELTKTHKIAHFALFDQFPYTKHIESGVILQKLS
ncbi:MAG: tRNA (uridine(54)-C5)-methyltransferase TrmA, partial [Campylobacteraceae bacterium]|nr:tRNA (uridine(54)-C5)-methyltransferase TrmA [Campylobacteraceae bacterium]